MRCELDELNTIKALEISNRTGLSVNRIVNEMLASFEIQTVMRLKGLQGGAYVEVKTIRKVSTPKRNIA